MRKQDRIANQESGSHEAGKLNQSESHPESQDRERMRGSSESERRRGSGESERMRGGGSERMESGSDSQRSPRQSGKLPLPD